MNLATLISFVLIGIYLYLQKDTVWFNFVFRGVELGYDPNLVHGVQSIIILCLLIGFIVRNDVDHIGRGSRRD